MKENKVSLSLDPIRGLKKKQFIFSIQTLCSQIELISGHFSRKIVGRMLSLAKQQIAYL